MSKSENGFAMLEAVLAIGLVGLVSIGLLSVSGAMTSQSTSSRDVMMSRLVAEQIGQRATAHGCGLHTGAEAATVIASTVLRCNTAMGITGVLFGDIATSITRKQQTYVASLRTHWLPSTDADNSASVTCASLATMEPHALQRDVNVAWTSSESAQNTYTLSQVEAQPVDASSAANNLGALLVTNMSSADAVDLQAPLNTSYRLRRFGSMLPSTTTTNGCAWFPFLPAGSYVVSGAGESNTCTVVVVAATTTSLAFNALPTAARTTCFG
jgi:hypothetical protein